MARRESEEISAGSMADIAFLLLIFFIVTTTMDLEAGIPQMLAMDIEPPEGYVPPKVKERDVFSIKVNANDDLFIEDEIHLAEDIPDMLYQYFTANALEEKDEKWARYETRNIQICNTNIKLAQEAIALDSTDIVAESDMLKWEKRKFVCENIPGNEFREMTETAVIQLKQQSKSSYGNYISIKNAIGTVIYQLRDEKCRELYNGRSYSDLDLEKESDQTKERILRVIVPEKILEPKINK